MARVSTFNVNGELSVCRTIKFEKNPLWTKMLGPIPSKIEAGGGDEGTEPQSEYVLQRLIELHPEVLPWHEFCDSPNEEEVRVCVICRETSSAQTDVLILERTGAGTGRYVIVETKLIKNPEIYRAVLGQVLEYAARLSTKETLVTLEEKAYGYWQTRASQPGGDFQKKMRTVFGEDWRETAWKTAYDNLRTGNIRLLVVSDSLPEDLRLAVIFLPSNVLLSAIEVQTHQPIEKDAKPVFTAANSAVASGPEALLATAQQYFSKISFSLGTLKALDTSHVIGEAYDRGRPSPPKVRRLYNSHLEKLGGNETVPGKILEMLRQETLQTEGGYFDEGGVFLTFRLWGLAGLNVREDKGELYIQFWPSTALGTNTRSDEARKIFQTVFDPTKNREDFYKTGKYHFFFRPIKSNSRLEEGKRLLQLLELVYERLHNVK